MNSLIIEQSNLSTEQVEYTIIDKLYRLALTSNVEDPQNNFEMRLVGSIRATAAYEDAVEYLNTKFYPDLTITVLNNNYYIRFKDPVVQQYCISKYGDGVGVTKDALRSVTGSNIMSDINKSEVTSLNDFQYFTGVGYNTVITGFTNATEIKFPAKAFVNTEGYDRNVIDLCPNLLNIDYGGATFDATNARIRPIPRNEVITKWDKSFLPALTDFSNVLMFSYWTKIQNIIIPEGVTSVCEKFIGCAGLLYVEYPSTITSLGSWREIGRDGSSNYVVVIKATTPPAAYYCPNENSNNQGGWGWHKFPISIYVPDSAETTYKNVLPLDISSDTWADLLIWCSESIKNRIHKMSELPASYRELGTVTQEDIDRV